MTDSVVILDVEGSDSSSRDDNNSFERRSGLFTLSLSSAFIINIKQKVLFLYLILQEIGRQIAGNFSLLKTIFELNLQLFQKEKYF